MNEVREHRIYNYKFEEPDSRDLKFPEIVEVKRLKVGPLPKVYNLRRWFSAIEDQKELGSCTAQAWVGIMEFHQNFMGRGGAKFENLSPLFIYYNERDLEGTIDEDAGAELRSGTYTLAKDGVCLEKLWTYNINAFNQKPPQVCYDTAKVHKITNYYSIRTFDNLKRSIANNLPVAFGFLVYSSFESDKVSQSGIVPMPDVRNEELLGGHAVVCFTGDTKISLMNGNEISLKELTDTKANERFWVYSCDKNGNVVPGLAHSPRKTGIQKNIVKVTIDNGESIKCTSNHQFLMRNGMYKEAGKLKNGDSLMPLYRKKEIMYGESDYEKFLNPRNNKWYYTHRSSMLSTQGVYNGIVHHKDFNRFNNSIDNLSVMNWDGHTKLHNENVKLLNDYAKSQRGRTISREVMKSFWSDPIWREKTIIQNRKNGGLLKQRGISNKINRQLEIKIRHNSDEYKQMRKRVAIKNLSKTIGLPITETQRLARVNNAKKISNEIRKNAQLKTTYTRFYTDKYPTFESYLLFKNNIQNQPINHKVISVESCGVEDVYDITVEEHHNFALSAGVFVHNCIGYNDYEKRFLVRNSWGPDWGLRGTNAGYFTMPYDYLANPNLASDFWCVVKIAEDK